MLIELGHYALHLAFFLNIAVLLYSLAKTKQDKMILLTTTIKLNAWLVSFSLIILISGFLRDNFNLNIIANHSHASLPIQYKISAIWSSHEGSLLLWLWIFNLWSLTLLNLQNRNLQYAISAYRTALILNCTFLALLIYTANPFLRLTYTPIDGADLNPFLQDFAFLIHPPILYIGYVGLSIPFIHSIAQMLTRAYPENVWSDLIRIPTLIAWAFLSFGITLGSFWAYYELGWGGFWFWDPVENASLIPWISTTALLHALIGARKLGKIVQANEPQNSSIFHNWSKLLAIICFALSLVGLFIVRSGIISSVHSFAFDPKRGIVILAILMLTLIISLSIFIKTYMPAKNLPLATRSKGSLLLLNSFLLITISGVILFGTLYPILHQWLYNEQLSVGGVYFTQVITPLFLPLMLLMVPGIVAKWFNNNGLAQFKFTLLHGLFALLASFIPFIIWGKFSYPILTYSLLPWLVIIATSYKLIGKIWQRSLSYNACYLFCGHVGLAICILGIILQAHYKVEQDLSLKIGGSSKLDRYTITFTKIIPIEGANYLGWQGEFLIRDQKKTIKLLSEKRTFIVPNLTVSEVGIAPGLYREIYIGLGEKIKPDLWSMRIYLQPFVRLIWTGGVMMFSAGLLMLWRLVRC